MFTDGSRIDMRKLSAVCGVDVVIVETKNEFPKGVRVRKNGILGEKDDYFGEWQHIYPSLPRGAMIKLFAIDNIAREACFRCERHGIVGRGGVNYQQVSGSERLGRKRF